MAALFIISNTQTIPRSEQGETHGFKTGEDEDDLEWNIGFYPPSLAYPFKHLKMKGMEIGFCSPSGGEVTVDTWGMELWDHPVIVKCFNDPDVVDGLKNTKPAKDVNGADYDIIHFVGSHGAFFDIAESPEVNRVVRECYEAGGIISANNDGVSGILNVKLSNGEYLVKGKKCTGASKVEQGLFDQAPDLPFILEDKMKEQGCLWRNGIPVRDHVIKDQRLITGQNPNSAEPLARGLGMLAKAIVKEKKLQKEQEAAKVA